LIKELSSICKNFKNWNIIKDLTLGKYFDSYLWTDVVLLADAFENFRYVCLKGYGLNEAVLCNLYFNLFIWSDCD
jgi:hypothetical protein